MAELDLEEATAELDSEEAMAELDSEEATAAFPVVLYNGEHRINICNVEIQPTLDYKQFQIVLKQMIGISYTNLTTYLVDSKKAIQPQQRKILITSKVNLSGLVREKTGYFLVVLKRSRRVRRKKPNKQFSEELTLRRFTPSHILLEQLDMNDVQLHASATCFGKLWRQESQMERANYINSMILNWDRGFDWPINTDYHNMMESCPNAQSCRNRELCADCTNAERQGEEASFHCCVYDKVLEGFFRSPVGPISRPQR